MVKSYTGVRKVPEKEVQDFQVKDFMTRKLITFKPDQPIGEVADILMKKNISGGPVLDENNKLCGIISEGDCLKEFLKGQYTNSLNHDGIVGDHMVKQVLTTTPETAILEIAQRFLQEKVRRFPVMEDGKLVGQISQRDVLSAVNKLKKSTW